MTIHDSTPHVLIIGGGLAGTATALRILNDATQPLRLTVVESRSAVGRGLAYSTAHREHLVNGVARMFSVYDDQPDHLVDWLQAAAAAGGWQPPAGVAWSASLPPRQVYGDYLQATLTRAVSRAAGRVRFTHRRTRAIDLEPVPEGTPAAGQAPNRQDERVGERNERASDRASGSDADRATERAVDRPSPGRYRVRYADGAQDFADAVVLATGVFARPLSRQRFVIDGAVESAPRLVSDIWARGSWDAVAEDQHIVYLGAGLSALDSLIIAEKAGFRGQHTVLSRRGLAVQARADVEPWPDFLRLDPAAFSLAEVLAQIRVQRRAVREQGESWQRLVAAIRPHVPAFWAAASDRERQRFLGRLRSFWESALHRSAAAPLAWQAAVAGQGRFTHRAAGIESVALRDDGRFDVTWRSNADADRGQRHTVTADRVVNCLGFEFDWHKVDDPLVRRLLARGLVSADRSGFGIRATREDHAVIDASGRVREGLHVVGHALRGLIWESNAIPEHVPQAGAVGRAIVAGLGSAVVPGLGLGLVPDPRASGQGAMGPGAKGQGAKGQGETGPSATGPGATGQHPGARQPAVEPVSDATVAMADDDTASVRPSRQRADAPASVPAS